MFKNRPRFRFHGDKRKAESLYMQAWQFLEAMKPICPSLPQKGPFRRIFQDGTEYIVREVFGQGFIDVFVPVVVAEHPEEKLKYPDYIQVKLGSYYFLWNIKDKKLCDIPGVDWPVHIDDSESTKTVDEWKEEARESKDREGGKRIPYDKVWVTYHAPDPFPTDSASWRPEYVYDGMLGDRDAWSESHTDGPIDDAKTGEKDLIKHIEAESPDGSTEYDYEGYFYTIADSGNRGNLMHELWNWDSKHTTHDPLVINYASGEDEVIYFLNEKERTQHQEIGLDDNLYEWDQKLKSTRHGLIDEHQWSRRKIEQGCTIDEWDRWTAECSDTGKNQFDGRHAIDIQRYETGRFAGIFRFFISKKQEPDKKRNSVAYPGGSVICGQDVSCEESYPEDDTDYTKTEWKCKAIINSVYFKNSGDIPESIDYYNMPRNTELEDYINNEMSEYVSEYAGNRHTGDSYMDYSASYPHETNITKNYDDRMYKYFYEWPKIEIKTEIV